MALNAQCKNRFWLATDSQSSADLVNYWLTVAELCCCTVASADDTVRLLINLSALCNDVCW